MGIFVFFEWRGELVFWRFFGLSFKFDLWLVPGHGMIRTNLRFQVKNCNPNRWLITTYFMVQFLTCFGGVNFVWRWLVLELSFCLPLLCFTVLSVQMQTLYTPLFEAILMNSSNGKFSKMLYSNWGKLAVAIDAKKKLLRKTFKQ